MSAYMKKNEVVRFLTNFDEDSNSALISSVQSAKGDENIDVTVLEDLFVKHMKGDAANVMTKLENEVTTYYDSEYFAPEDGGFEDWNDSLNYDEEEDDWFDGDNVSF